MLNSKQRNWVIAGLVATLILISVGVVFKKGYRDVFREKPDKFSVVKYFPTSFTANNPVDLYPDPYDANIVWFVTYGGILKYDAARQAFTQVIGGPEGITSSPRSLIRKQNDLFVALNGGFKKINLKTGQTKFYGIKDGLVNGANLILRADSEDNDVIWIATFDGLSKFSILSEKFVNFREETKIAATSFGVQNIGFGQDSVWIVVQANAYSRGGIARYDKKTNTWEAWSPEAFGTSSRIDFWKMDAYEGEVMAYTYDSSGQIFQFVPAQNSWKRLMELKSSQPPVYALNKIYFQPEGQDSLSYLDLNEDSRQAKVALPKAGSASYDVKNHRLILLN